MSDVTEEQTIKDGYPCSGSSGEQTPDVAPVVVD